MPKLIIPNAYELYQPDSLFLTQDDINSRYFYNLRFLWLLEAGDAIILPKCPNYVFLNYFAKVKKLDLNTINIVVLNEKHASLNSNALSDDDLIESLRSIISIPSNWKLQTCYYNHSIFKLSLKLGIPVKPQYKDLIKTDFIKCINSKVFFRKIATENSIPASEGVVCATEKELLLSLRRLLKQTGQVIAKQEYNASGKGNIGIGIKANQSFVGVIKQMIIQLDQSIEKVANDLWSSSNHILEVYYPNTGTFTAQYWSPAQGEPVLINYSEILMESRWVGIQMPPRLISQKHTEELIEYSKKLAQIIQAQGYEGYLCCDAILTHDDRIVFTEINVRPGAESHAYVLTEHLFGKIDKNKIVIQTHNMNINHSFREIYQQLNENSLLINDRNNFGVVVLTVDDDSHKLEYLIAAPDCVSAQRLKLQFDSIAFS